MRLFTINMVRRLIKEESFGPAFQDVQKELQNSYLKVDKLKIIWVGGEPKNSDEKLFDKNKYYSPKKLLQKGEVTYASSNLVMSNITSTSREFYGRKLELHQLLKFIHSHI